LLTPEEIEIKLLSSVKTMSDISKAGAKGVTEDSFLLYGEVWTYIRNYAEMYDGNVPKQVDVIARFRDTEYAIEFDEAGEVEFYADELMAKHTARKISAAVASRFGDGGVHLHDDPYEVVRLLSLDLKDMVRFDDKHAMYWDRDGIRKVEWLRNRAELAASGQLTGIPTGLSCFDDTLQGWQSGEAIFVVAPKGTGKSWLLLYFAAKAYASGHKVLFLSPEMSNEECSWRLDVLLAHMHAETLSHTALTTGKGVDLEAYEEWVNKFTCRADMVLVDSTGRQGFNVPDILALQEEHQPDMMLVDGIHLVIGQAGQQGWEVIKEIADKLKASAQFHKNVVIWAGQADSKSMSKMTEPISDGSRVAYGKSSVEAANRMITLGLDEDSEIRRVFRVPHNRGGKEYKHKQYLLFDVDVGAISQIDYEVPEEFEGAF
jgi:hypothetical protein